MGSSRRDFRREMDDAAAMEPGPAKTAAIRELAETLQELSGDAAAMRKAEVLRVREAEKLSLAQLASRLGISKARAGQVVEDARKEREAANG